MTNYPSNFWSRVRKSDSNSCWIWTGATNSGGYGHYTLNYKQIKAHRTSYELSNNIILTDKDEILHKCDNPPCCNPKHLVKGTRQDNMIDMVRKGRSTSKLTPTQVEEIRIKSNIKRFILAKEYGVSESTISRIINNKRWNCL